MKKHLKRAATSLHPKRLQKSYATKRTFMNFAEDKGLVYFGRVHHNDEDLQVLRGLTLSQTHRDNHYCVGSIRGYDIAIVERTDTSYAPHRPIQHRHWLIFSFDLLTSKDLPHIFVYHNHYGAEFREIITTKFDRIPRVTVGALAQYDDEFIKNYSIHTKIAHAIDGERLIDNEIARTIMHHFGKLSIEIVNNTLYIYADHTKVSAHLLDTILKNGLWLAGAIDKNANEKLFQ